MTPLRPRQTGKLIFPSFVGLHVPTVASLTDPKVAAHLLDPLRARLLVLARHPMSASQLAEKVGLPRQRVNYHVRTLAKAGLLREAGRRERRNLTEVLYQATATRWLVDPAALVGLAPEADAVAEKGGTDHLLALAARTQHEVGLLAAAGSAGNGATSGGSAIDLEVKLPGAPERDAFARALQEAVAGVVARFGATGRGHAQRVVAVSYPRPREGV